MEWWKNFCYRPSLDEIDPELPDGEKTIRQIAKHTSKICTFFGYLLMFPITLVFFILDKFGGELLMKFMFLFILLPARYMFYYLIYLPLKLPVMISGEKK